MRTDLATTTTAELKGCVQRLDQQAETVTQHQTDIGKLQIEIAERRLACPLIKTVEDDLVTHILACPMKARMDAVENYVITTRATAISNSHWIAKAMPIVYTAAGIGFY